MVKITGQSTFSNRLKRLRSPETKRQVARALFAGGQLIELAAERKITEGAISGAGHIPSKPGEPPNADTHHLDSSIDTTVEPARLLAKVTVNADYGPDLELGNSKIAERPFMRPATQEKRGEAVSLVGQAVSRIINGA